MVVALLYNFIRMPLAANTNYLRWLAMVALRDSKRYIGNGELKNRGDGRSQ